MNNIIINEISNIQAEINNIEIANPHNYVKH